MRQRPFILCVYGGSVGENVEARLYINCKLLSFFTLRKNTRYKEHSSIVMKCVTNATFNVIMLELRIGWNDYVINKCINWHIRKYALQ